MITKYNGKMIFLQNVPDDCIFPAGWKFHQNHSDLHHFLDKCIFAFDAEIQHDHQKLQENNFC